MTLERDTGTRGLWRDASVPAGGVHALIIGISDYPYLANGTATQRAPENGGMGQLEVSARTGARVFEWLSRRGSAGGAPVASCRLCLAPRPAEAADVDRATGGHHADATFKSIRDAVEAWGNDLAKGGTGSATNVSFFLFSGHGVEHVASPALLASDILDPTRVNGPKNAAGFNAIWQSVRTYGVDRAFFFIDACRNAPELVKTLHIVGADLLEPIASPPRAPEAVAWLQATRMGDYAYQSTADDTSIFGAALLEALEGPPPQHLPYDRNTKPWQLVFANLESHVKQRVRELLLEHGTTNLQPVEPGGYPYNGGALVAVKPPERVDPAASVSLPGDADDLVLEAVLPEDTRKLIAARATSTLKEFHSASLQPARFDSGALKDFGVMHEVLGHEDITAPWINGLRLLDAWSGLPLDDDVVELVGGKRHVAGDRTTAWIDIVVAPGAGDAAWIEWQAPNDAHRLAVVVPRDLHVPTPVRIDVEFRHDPSATQWNERWSVNAMTARLADPSDALDGDIWGPLWDVQRIEALSDLASAADAADRLKVLESALYRKMKSPTAAAIAAALLLRAGAVERVHDWPRNLADRYPWLVDGSVLWAETLLMAPHDPRTRERIGSPIDEARIRFARCATHGAPLLGPVLAMAARQALRWRNDIAEGRVDAPLAETLAIACDVVERAAANAEPGSTFAAFSSTREALRPAELLGRPRVTAAEDAIAAVDDSATAAAAAQQEQSSGSAD